MDETESSVPSQSGSSRKAVGIKIVITLGIILVIGTVGYFLKGWFVAATVNGVPVSRFAVINELEKTWGEDALNVLISQKLIDQAAREKGVAVAAEDVNAEVESIRTQIEAQGGTLDEALTVQGLTLETLQKQILIQKEIEGLLGDQLAVTDAEIDAYIVDNEITIPEGQEEDSRGQISDMLRQQKFNAAANTLVTQLRADATVRTFVNY